jgi:hypothetical protein
MKVREKVWALKDIGPLDGHLILPMALRMTRGMKTVCEACGKNVIDDKFLGGFKKGFHNMVFHVECVPENERGNTMGKP